MIFEKEIARQVAAELLQIKAIKLQPEDPFTWASGWKSPIYCDNRILLSYPEARDLVRDRMVEIIRKEYAGVEWIAGVATGAIAMGVLVAQALDLPFVYVRPQPKSHGRKNQVEGYLEEDRKIVVVEDLISTGGSSLKAVEALRNQGCKVMGMTAVFTYGFKVAETNFSTADCKLRTLSNYDHLLELAHDNGYINSRTMDMLREWRKNPDTWSSSKS